jgi:large-conductance mechanosensitive channel
VAAFAELIRKPIKATMMPIIELKATAGIGVARVTLTLIDGKSLVMKMGMLAMQWVQRLLNPYPPRSFVSQMILDRVTLSRLCD